MRTQKQYAQRWTAENPAVGILLLRLFLSCRLLYGVIDNILSWERMLEFSAFLGQHHFPWPTLSAVTSVYVQAICALLILIGYQTRTAALLLAINFLIALLMVHLAVGDTIEGMTPALAMLFASLTLIFTGAKDFSLDKRISQSVK